MSRNRRRLSALDQASRSMFEIKHRTAKSKVNCEDVYPSPLPGVGIEHDAVLGFSVLRWSFRIQHLEWISTASGARKNAVRIFLLQRRWRRCWAGTLTSLCRERFRRLLLR